MYWQVGVIGVAGAMGAILRFMLARWVQSFSALSHFPWGILLCNFLGCFLIGVCFGLFDARQLIAPLWRVGIMVGFLGGFTTFSSSTLDTLQFFQAGNYLSGTINIFANVVFCLLATAIGIWLSLVWLK